MRNRTSPIAVKDVAPRRPDLSRRPRVVTICFRHPNSPGCLHSYSTNERFGLTLSQLRSLVTTGSAKCAKCELISDFKDRIRNFPLFGYPEGLFGLPATLLTKSFAPSSTGRVEGWDIRNELPHEGQILYGQYSGQVEEEGVPGPRLLAPANAHRMWPFHLAVHVPPSKGEQILSLMCVLSPKVDLDLPLKIAIQAVGQFHRNEFDVAAFLLGASVEASVRSRVEREYAKREVSLDDRAGLGALFERARVLLEPTPGSTLVKSVKELARVARNPVAHGRKTSLTRNQVAEWMVDTAVVYEWARLARSAYSRRG